MASVVRQACNLGFFLLVLLSFYLNARLFLSQHLLPTGPQSLIGNAKAEFRSTLKNTLQETNIASQSGGDVNHSPDNTTLIWKDSCQVWSTQSTTAHSTPPTGIAVTLAKRKNKKGKDLLTLLCQKVPTQQAYFYEPQGIDLLMLIEIENVTFQQVAECLELKLVSTEPFYWQNLDGSTLTTYEYRSKTGRGKVYLSPFEMHYPEYIQQNRSRLTEKMDGCDRGTDFEDYVQGTRYYSNDVLHLAILKDYDYLLKVDLDIEFRSDQLFPFHLLNDMRLKRAMFGHTGEFLPKGFGGCTKNLNEAVGSFVGEGVHSRPSWAQQANWTKPCSAGVDAFERGKDQYYTNLVVMSVEFFQSPHVRAFGKWMNEYYPGFFRYGWTDQVYFHKAMGLFLGPDFRDYVADYTDFRCKKFGTCWFPWAGAGKKTKTNPSHKCAAGGIFHHGKVWKFFGTFNGTFPNVSATLSTTPYISKYQHNCSII